MPPQQGTATVSELAGFALVNGKVTNDKERQTTAADDGELRGLGTKHDTRCQVGKRSVTVEQMVKFEDGLCG